MFHLCDVMSYVISRIDILCPKHRRRRYYYSLEPDLGYPAGEAGQFPYNHMHKTNALHFLMLRSHSKLTESYFNVHA